MAIISEDRSLNVCLKGQGKNTCSYLVFGSTVWLCAKADHRLKAKIEERRQAGTINAMGDNCNGFFG